MSSINERDCHFTWNFLQNLDTDYLQELRGQLLGEYKDEPYTRRHTIMNLLGFVYCQLKDFKSATETFSIIQKEDPENLNALNNVQHVYRKRGQLEKCKTFRREVDTLLNNKDENSIKVIRGRSLIEKARAACITRQECKQDDVCFVKSMYSEGLELGKDNTDEAEMLDWKFGYAYHLFRINAYFRNRNKYYLSVSYCEESIKHFYEITQSKLFFDSTLKNDCSNDLKAKAWTFIGVLLNKNKQTGNFQKLSDVLLDICSEEHCNMDDKDCLHKGEEIAPCCATVLRRIGTTSYHMNDLDKALEYLEKAKKYRDVGSAYSPIGTVYRHKYILEKDPQLLDIAIANYKTSIEKHNKHSSIYWELAMCYELKGDLDAALDHCHLGSESFGGTYDENLFNFWADCLEKAGDKEGANEKRVYSSNICKMQFQKKYKFAAIFSSVDMDTVEEIVAKVEDQYNVKGYMFQRNCIPGSNILKEVEKIELNCQFILMFVSENFNESMWCQNELGFIIQKRATKNAETVIPIWLQKSANLPFGLAEKHAAIYGSKEFWNKLDLLFKN